MAGRDPAACRSRLLPVLLLVVLSAGLLPAADNKPAARLAGHELDDVMGELDLTLRWEPIMSRYLFVRRNETLSVLEGSNFLVRNGTEVIGIPGEGFSLLDAPGQARAAGLLRSWFPPLSGSAAQDIKTIFIDPGHGGKDVGAVGRFLIDGKTVSLNEKDVTLAIAGDLAARLEKRYPDKKIVMSRSRDQYLPLDERTRIANKYAKKNDNTLFVSIHANASLDPKGSGYEVWYLPPEYRRQLIEEDEYLLLDKSLYSIINSMVEEGYSIASRLLAQSILNGLKDAVGSLSINRGLKEEEWYVVRNARMPSVLIEVGFVTNRDEFQNLRTSRYLNKLAEGIYNGMVAFIGDYENPSLSGGQP